MVGMGYGSLCLLPLIALPRLRTVDLDSLIRERLVAHVSGSVSHLISIDEAVSIPINKHAFWVLTRFITIGLDLFVPNARFTAGLVTSYDQVVRLASISRELQRRRNTATRSTFAPGGAQV